MKNYIKISILNLLLFLVSLEGYSQIEPINKIDLPPKGQIDIIQGPNTVNQNETHVYYVEVPKNTEAESEKWSVKSGTILGTSTNKVKIKWPNIGIQTIYYSAIIKGVPIQTTYNVTVDVTSSLPPATPSKPYITNQNCINATLYKGSSPIGVSWYWQGTNSNGTSTNNSSRNYIAKTSGTYYLRARDNNTGLWSTSSSYVKVTMGIVGGTTWYADTDGDGLGDPNSTKIQCEQPNGYVDNPNDQCPTVHGGGNYTGCPCTSVTWYADVDEDGLGDVNSTKVACEQPLGYVNNSNDQCPTISGGGTATGCPKDISLSNDNYVYTVTPQIPVKSTLSLTQNKDAIKTVTYYDGLGRTKQRIGIKLGKGEKDIVTHIAYDALGRQPKKYLPYTSIGDGALKNDPVSALNSFYRTHHSSDINDQFPNPYAEVELDNSPLNRIVKKAEPGYDWRLGGGHEIKFDFQSNITNEVRRFYVTTTYTDGVYIPTLQIQTDATTNNNGYYNPGELFKTVKKDENYNEAVSDKLHTIEKFKNKKGQLILKRMYAKAGFVTPHDTYYVHDDFGNLTYVIPPKVNTKDGISDDELNELCYQYKYDHRNRMVEKKIPGKSWEYIVYNKLDQPILTQDANQRLQNEWLFIKYDVLGRVVFTGLYKHPNAISRNAMQLYVNSGNHPQYVTRKDNTTTIANTSVYYSNDVIPTNVEEIHTVYYYDNYEVGNIVTSNPATKPRTWEGMTSVANVKGLPTVSQINVLGTDKWITTVTYYDEKGRSWESHVKNEYLNSEDWVSNKLDFTGRILKTRDVHNKNNITTTILYKFEYDHAGRLKKETQQINNQPEEVIVENTYNELGQLSHKGIGGRVSENRLQTVDYKYNIRGWLQQINDPNNIKDDLFSFAINYNKTAHGTTGLFNGNITESEWKTANDNVLRWYSYTYDALNRLKNGIDNSGNYSLTDVTYDKNGNILTLERKGHINEQATSFGIMDKLTYTYDSGNKLLKVLDSGNRSIGYHDKTSSSPEYAYDANGNMTTDLNKSKSITNIVYNHLNLPTLVQFNNGNDGDIQYIYDALGNKVEKIVREYISNNNVYTTTSYLGNFVYKNNDLQFLKHLEGYSKYTANGKFDYVYQYKDHLDNVRLSYTDGNLDGVIDKSEIIEESNYYPFGLKHKGYNNIVSSYGDAIAQKFGYNGKELNEELGIQWHDFGARHYDAALGRWMNLDPLAEEMRRHSPYNYAFNNPIFFIDPDGMAPMSADDASPPDPEDENKESSTQNNDDGGGDDENKVAIDAGHGIDGDNNPQIDPGTSGNGHKEKDLALNISKYINAYLQYYGEETVMIREGDLTVDGNSLVFRTDKAKDEGANIFVSIHINAAKNENAKGFVVLYKDSGPNAEKNKDLAQSIVGQQTVMTIRGNGIKTQNLQVLRDFSSTGPAVLVEVGFITNQGDVDKMTGHTQSIGRDIAKGIFIFMNGTAPNIPDIDLSPLVID
ncbi:N-acetylmuramoyl-L-alanine amidase [Tenacibaculum sp. 190524A05c]|uniref:DUF6443 domain-containing protein n=1 Tax=Tenacibaculum platacis TaxID=3137852 RepID=UPI0031FA4CCF